MAHSDQKFTKPPDKEEIQSTNTYGVTQVDFNGKMITRTYDRHLNNEKK